MDACIVGGNVNRQSPLRRIVWRFLEKLGIKLPYNPTITLLGIYSEETITEKDKQKITSVGKDAQKLELLYILGGNVKQYTATVENYGNSSKKSSLELPYDPAVTLNEVDLH